MWWYSDLVNSIVVLTAYDYYSRILRMMMSYWWWWKKVKNDATAFRCYWWSVMTILVGGWCVNDSLKAVTWPYWRRAKAKMKMMMMEIVWSINDKSNDQWWQLLLMYSNSGEEILKCGKKNDMIMMLCWWYWCYWLFCCGKRKVIENDDFEDEWREGTLTIVVRLRCYITVVVYCVTIVECQWKSDIDDDSIINDVVMTNVCENDIQTDDSDDASCCYGVLSDYTVRC